MKKLLHVFVAVMFVCVRVRASSWWRQEPFWIANVSAPTAAAAAVR